MTMLMSSRVAADTSGTEVLDLIGKLDQDGNGVITVDEFKATVRADPRLLECFGRLFGVNEGGTGEVGARVVRARALAAVRGRLFVG